MSGNLTLTIPLGPRFKLTDDFSYGVTLYYNSKIWEHTCPNGPGSYLSPCAGSLPPYTDYGLGFSMIPGRVYHHADDHPYVYRVQLEDGSDHFFCDNPPAGKNCDNFTSDSAHIQMSHFLNASGQQGWKAETTDGRTIEFARVLNTTSHEALATRVATTGTRPNGQPRAFVDYGYSTSPATPYLLTEILDSQGRSIQIGGTTADRTITFPAFSGFDTYTPGTRSTYLLHLEPLSFYDPSDAGGAKSKYALKRIEFPGLGGVSESYRFNYTPSNDVSFGWMTQRTLPTGAVIDYYYDVFTTSKRRPYHTELTYKTLTLVGAPVYRWSWNRFSLGPPPGTPTLPTFDPEHPSVPNKMSASNPYQVAVHDPFNNLTLYDFEYTAYSADFSNCDQAGECPNSWDDGLLTRVSTYAGPDPDTARLVRQVNYVWDSDRDSAGNHKMFQYKPSVGTSPPANVNSTSVNSRQLEESTFVPGHDGNGGHTVTVKSLEWYPWTVAGDPSIRPRQKDEYIDGVKYRSTYTKIAPSGGNWDAHSYVKVTDASGNVVSRVDRKFNEGRLECEFRRKGTTHDDMLDNCSTNNISLGDVALINTFDDVSAGQTATGATLSTKIQGGDLSSTDYRTVTMSYVTYTPTGGVSENTALLKTKNYGFDWNAVNRVVDFNTGLTAQTHDPAGNTTKYEWDALGRLTRIEPAFPERATEISYPHIYETHVRQELTSSNYVETVYFYDGLGRLITTQRRNATGSLDVQQTEYDIAGRVTRKSEWAPDGTPPAALKWTAYDYTMYTDPDGPQGADAKHPDPLGRIHGVTTPDDLTPLTPTTETTYDGNSTTVTVRDIQGWASDIGVPISSSTTYTKDALGRLVSVDSPGNGADAIYSYDESDNLTEVRLNDPATPAHIQVRHFDYDMLGRLRLASNPENGTIEYSKYDGRGNLLVYKDAHQNVFKMAYDLADRLLTRTQSVSNVDFLLSSATYDLGIGFDSGGSSGRLVQQESYKIEDSVAALVSRVRFHYGAHDSSDPCAVAAGVFTGLNGRLSWQRTTLTPWSAPLITNYCQDALGMPTTISYPDLLSGGRTRSIVASTYQNGYLSEFHDEGRGVQYIKSVAYAAGGVPTTIIRGNLQRDVVDLDARNRPTRFRTSGYSYPDPSAPEGEEGGTGPSPSYYGPTPQGWLWSDVTLRDSGTYTYDMAGNVESIGSEAYYYDALSRLVHGSVPGAGFNHVLDFTYDAFGNMTWQKRTASNGSLPVDERTYTIDWQTNRLTQKTLFPGTPVGFTFDENGNVTEEGERAYVFDGPGRLREVIDPEKGRIGNYDYDASGYRVRAESDGTETFYLRDASGQVLSEFQRPIGGVGPPTWNKDYIYAFGKSWALVKNQLPSAPKRPSAGDVTTTSLTLHWDPVSDPDVAGYQLTMVRKQSTNSTEELPQTFGLSAENGYTFNSSYAAIGAGGYVKYSLMAMDTAGNFSAPGPELLVYPASAAPGKPTNVVTTPGDGTITVRWTPPTVSDNALRGYSVERQDGGPLEPWNKIDYYLIVVPKFVDPTVVNGQTYHYRVTARDTSGRLSPPSDPSVATVPRDNVPPGKLADVFAEPGRGPGRVDISWHRGADPDVVTYRIYRTNDTGDTPPPSSFAAVSGQVSYTKTDTTNEAGTFSYTVVAVDASGNASAASDPVSARPRSATVNTPVLSSAPLAFTVNFMGTTDTNDFTMEDDDLLTVVVSWQRATPDDHPTEYRVYRKALDEIHFTKVGTVPWTASGTFSFPDTSVTKADYTYYVTAWNQTTGEESAATPESGAAGSAPDHAFQAFIPANVKVRTLYVEDGRAHFSTDNAESRLASVYWTRVVAPGLTGYNVYRSCSVGQWTMHFDCEEAWMKLNSVPVPPQTRRFDDASIGGLQGIFGYIVRPVGPNGIEGYVGQDVGADLTSRSSNGGEIHSPIGTFDPAVYLPANSATRGAPTASLHAPNNAASSILTFDPETFTTSLYARVTWTMNDPPANLLGFYVESAGSPDGPWQRLTKHPIAWWERQYTTTGVGVYRCRDLNYHDLYSGHTECLQFRVIAVDEAGNESAPTIAPDPHVIPGSCPMTPAAPTNLRASNGPPLLDGSCTTRLDWDASPGAAEYIVYRAVDSINESYFYDTQRVTGQTYYIEDGSDSDIGSTAGDACWDHDCPYSAVYTQQNCNTSRLNAYYVVARNVIGSSPGGESPRSNLVFWKCSATPGYASLSTDNHRDELVASLAAKPPAESLACWITDGANPENLVGGNATRRSTADPAALLTAPMTSLGGVDPPWEFLDLHTDHLGSVRLVTSNTGAIVSLHNYFPFGDEVPTKQFSYNTHQYTGHERDKDTGLDYMMARFYEAGVGRFLSVDPGNDTDPEHPESWNKYAYVRNNPINLVDPDGRKIKIDPNTGDKQKDKELKKEIKKDLKQIGKSDPKLRAEIKNLKKSDNVFTITMPAAGSGNSALPLNGADAQNGKGTGGTIYYDPTNNVDPSTGGTRDASVALTHELLGHGGQIDAGTIDRSLDPSSGIMNAEIHAVRMENLMRAQTGDPTRTTYGKASVPCPTCAP